MVNMISKCNCYSMGFFGMLVNNWLYNREVCGSVCIW